MEVSESRCNLFRNDFLSRLECLNRKRNRRMIHEWYSKIQNKLRGPLSTLQLKQLAFAGEILPDFRSRYNSDLDWVEVSLVIGSKYTSVDVHLLWQARKTDRGASVV